MAAYHDDLQRTLWFHEFGAPYDAGAGIDEPSHRIAGLVGMLQAFEVGDYEFDEVRRAFNRDAPKGFDFDLWFAEKQAEGVYETWEELARIQAEYDTKWGQDSTTPEELPENVVRLDNHRKSWLSW